MKQIMDEVARICSKNAPLRDTTYELSKYLRKTIRHYSWVGFYRLERDVLFLEGWDGAAPTQHTKIAADVGVCGLAAREKRTIIVDDVSRHPSYLQCFLETRSEIVVPIMDGAACLGEIDIDGYNLKAFNELDRIFLEWVAMQIVPVFKRK